MPRGGKREGAGRPSMFESRNFVVSIRLNQTELDLIQDAAPKVNCNTAAEFLRQVAVYQAQKLVPQKKLF